MKTSTPNWELLGALRFILAAAVVLCHARLWLYSDYPQTWDTLARSSVFGFFVISGYSIRASISRNPTGFYGRRWRRLAFTYYFCFALSFVPLIFLGPTLIAASGGSFGLPAAPDLWVSLLGSAVMLPGLVGGVLMPFLPAWSLGCEVVYYAAAPFILRLEDKRSYVVWAAMALSALVFVWMSSGDIAQWPILSWCSVVSLSWLWLLGWQLHRFGGEPWAHLGGVTLMAVLLSVDSPHEGALTLYSLLAPLAIAASPYVKLPILPAKLCLFGADISFPLYLSHISIMPFLLAAGWHSVLAALLIALALAAILNLVEVRLKAIRPALSSGATSAA